MYKGSCLCGQVQIEITGPIETITHCHCSQCRKNSGTAIATNGFVSSQHFKLVEGQEKLGRFEASPGKFRYFCSVCASPVYSANKKTPEYVRLRLGILDSDISERPESHIFFSSKANWENFDDQLPQYEGLEPSRDKFRVLNKQDNEKSG